MSIKNIRNEPAVPHIRKFNPGKYQSDEEIISQFVVRNHELNVILEVLQGNIHSPSCQHVLIVAPRGRGKTMLLARVAAELRTNDGFSERLLPVRFMEESQEIFNLADFWLETLFYLAGEVSRYDPGLARELEDTHAALTARWRESDLEGHARAAVLAAADRLDRKLVLMVENLQMLCGNVDEDFGWKLREALQSEPGIMLLASATSRFEGLDDARQPFFELFRNVNLERLSTEDCRRLWETLSGKETSSHEIRPLEILTGGSPRLLVIVAGFARHGSMRQLMEDLVTLIDEHTEYFRSHLENLSKTERRVYLAVVDLWRPSKPGEIAGRARMDVRTVSTMLKRLCDRGAVISEGSGRKKMYSAAERLYSIYYKLRREGDEAVVVRNLIHFMAVFYSESELSEMSARLIAEAMGSRVIREGIERAAAELSLGEQRQSIASISEQLLAEKEVNAAFEEKNFSKVVETVSNVMDSQNTSQPAIPEILTAELLRKKIIACEHLKDFETVISACDEMFERLEKSETPKVKQYVATAMAIKGDTYRELENFQAAVDAYEKLVERFGGSEALGMRIQIANALTHKGAVKCMLGRWESSISACEEVLERFGDSKEQDLQQYVARALLIRGTALGATGNFEASIAACDDIVRRFQNSEAPGIKYHVTAAMLNKAEMQILSLRPQDALYACEKAEQERLGIPDENDRDQLAWQIMCVRTQAMTVQGKHGDVMDGLRLIYDKFIPDEKTMMYCMLNLVQEMIAVGMPANDIINILSDDSTKSQALEPLILALRQHGGESVRAPAQVLELSRDIHESIERRKARHAASTDA